MSLASILTAALLAISMAQATGSPPRPPGDRPPPGAEGLDPAVSPGPAEEERLPQGIPFMPTVGAISPRTDGLFLDVALLSEVRTRTLSMAQANPTWGTDVEVTPGVGLELRTSAFSLSLGYAPRLSIPFNVGAFQLAVLNRATLRAEWRVDPRWTVTALGIFVVGDYSQLNPASTPGGAGPPPPILNPIRSFQTYPFVGIDTLLRVDGMLSRRTRLRLAGGYFDVGGTGAVGEANQPRAWGPLAEGAIAWDASSTATLTTTVAGQDWIMGGGYPIMLGTLIESWKQAWTGEFETTLSAGAGLSNREVESRTAVNNAFPLAGLRLDYVPASRRAFRFTLVAALAPFVDTYLRIPYQRITAGLTIDWRPSDEWQVGANLSAALAPYSVRAPESYGVAGASASYAPVPFLVLTLGGFSQVQFQGGTVDAGAFRQLSAYFSLAFRDRLSI